MPKGYWVIAWRSVSDPAAVARYAAIAAPVIESCGGRILARGNPVKTYEQGVAQRLVVVEFDSVANAIATYESAEYQASLVHLRGAAERDVRVIESPAASG